MKASSRKGHVGRRSSAAASRKSEKIVSAPLGGGYYSVSEKDHEGKVVITARAGRTTVPAKMADLVIRAAMELTGLSGLLAPVEVAPSTAVKAPPARAASSRQAAAAPARVAPAKGASTKGSASKGSSSRKPAEGKPPAKSPTAAKAAAKKAAGGRASAAPAAPKREAPVQSKSRMPDEISEYDKKINRKDTPASMTRRFFDDEKRWGYQVEIAGKEAGKLLFDREGVWNLIPTDERLAEGGVKATDHANPISAYVRVIGWSRAILPPSAAAA